MLGVPIVSSFIVIQTPRTTRAEGLLYTVTCVVGSLLSHNCPEPVVAEKPKPDPKPEPQKQPDDPPASSTEPPAGSSTTPLLSVNDSSHIVPPPPPVSSMSTTPLLGSGSQYPAHVSPLVRSTDDNGQSVLGATRATPLEATEQGWKILGVMWYWWTLVLGGLVAAALWSKPMISKAWVKLVR